MKVITIGRNPDNDIVIDDSFVSRHHCQIIQDDTGNFRLVDFGSSNGTFVNGVQITGEVMLNPNDAVLIGNTTLPWRSYFDNAGIGKNTKAVKEQKISQQFVNTVNQSVSKWIDEGKTDEEIIQFLGSQGYNRETSQKVIDNVKEIIETKHEQESKNILWGSLLLIFGLILTVGSYTAAIGGGTYIATYGVIIYGAVRFLTGLFSKKLQYGLIGLIALIILGIGVFMFISHSESNYKHQIQAAEDEKFNKINTADMKTIHPFNDKQISIAMPNTMVQDKIEDSTNSSSEYAEYYNVDDDIFRINVSRILKSNVRNDIKNLSDFVIVLQSPKDSLDNRRYTNETSIKCLADKNGHKSLYYCKYTYGNNSDAWAKVAYIDDKKYYYAVTVWTHPYYKDHLDALIDKTLSSFNIEK